MPAYVPDSGETLRDLVRRVLPGLPPGVRAGVQVVTGGERAGLVVPEHAAPAAEVAAPPKSPPARRAQRRRPKEN
ncbi:MULTISPECIES: hypothetical protein [Streptomycetaceae]|uniref:hypothetical protein n=1 Tax=Streptomycetaceae TaxID=2062 RepID=UPI00035F4CDE|nr:MULTISPECIES: hypothetical protein [Streptomycetaceae]